VTDTAQLAAASRGRGAADVVAVSDAVARAVAAARAASDTVAVSDVVTGAFTAVTGALDVVEVADFAARVMDASRGAADVVVVLDQAFVFKGAPTFEQPRAGNVAAAGTSGFVAPPDAGGLAADGRGRGSVVVSGRPGGSAVGSRGTIRREP
jgi:hypothetical protein